MLTKPTRTEPSHHFPPITAPHKYANGKPWVGIAQTKGTYVFKHRCLNYYLAFPRGVARKRQELVRHFLPCTGNPFPLFTKQPEFT